MDNKRINRYKSHFVSSDHAIRVLREGRIISEDESPGHMIERVVDSLTEVDSRFGTSPDEAQLLANEFGALLDEKYCVMSTPILTNAGRHVEKPLSACTVPSIDLAHDDFGLIAKIISRIHQDGMGTGFSLDELIDPVVTLKKLNDIAMKSALSGNEDRPVGNMATLSVYQPKILEFIKAKVPADLHSESWKFNISVDCDARFFESLAEGEFITLNDGTQVKAQEIFDQISQAASICADPGLVFLERMEEDNPIPGIGRYTTTAPCAEVGLIEGESCQFGYINLARFSGESGEIDIKKLIHATHLLTRMLDNALEISIGNYSEEANKRVMAQKRKIGIGICGLADLFVKQGLQYDSQEARSLALDLVTLVNFESKIASIGLAEIRGSFGAMSLPLENKYLTSPSFIVHKYGNLSTQYVSSEDWEQLSERIRSTKLLRNVSTIALPPTGRSALVIDASTGIEPVFSKDDYLILNPRLTQAHHPFIKTAKSITPEDHLLMASELQKGVDESISKTINLPDTASAEDIQSMYLSAWNLGLKGVSIYREGSKSSQPKRLS